MNPYLQARHAFHAEPPGMPWSDMLRAHYLHGYVINIPDGFACARRVSATWPDHRLLAPSQIDPKGDALHVYICAGNLRRMLQLMPEDLPPMLTFQRRSYRIHRLPTARLLRVIVPGPP